MTNQIFDEKVFDLLKKIEIPKNPVSFYFNISKIEKNLSKWLRDYFYKAINEFIYNSDDINNGNNFLLKVYYYTGFIAKLAFWINDILKDLKYYDIHFYLDCINEFDKNIKLKIVIFNLYKSNPEKIKEFFWKIQDKYEVMDLLQDKLISNEYQKDNNIIFEKFEENFYKLNNEKDKDLINFIYENINVNILKYPISYEKTRQDYKTFVEKWWEKFEYYKAINKCINKIVSKYNKYQINYKNNPIYRIIENFDNIKKNYYIKSLVEKELKNFEKWKIIHIEKNNNNFFESIYKFEIFLITYIINNKHYDLKKLFYWEATKNRLSEDNWAKIGGGNIFYLSNIDKNIWNIEMLMFFKQFKDMLIDLNNSISWVFIKPYFYYLIIFKSIKLQLKDWKKLFFLLMFFSAESYQEYVILQNIIKSIENIWLWKIDLYNIKFLFYIKRFFIIGKEFFSSIILLTLLIIWLYFGWLINIIMLWIILLLIFINLLKYIFFPWKFEIIRIFVMLSMTIIWYVWFITIFPKIIQTQYLSYIWSAINSFVNLDFSWAKENYDNMIKFVYSENYKKNEQNMLASFYGWTLKIKNNEKIQQITTQNTRNVISSIIKNPYKYISIKKWTYLRYYINKEIDKLNIDFQKKQELSKKVLEQYIQWYCFTHQDIYCKNKLETLPVGFKLNITKIQEFINNNL